MEKQVGQVRTEKENYQEKEGLWENEMFQEKEDVKESVLKKNRKGKTLGQERPDGKKASIIRPLLWAYGGTALACVLVVLTSFSMEVSALLTFPYGLIGRGLRALSLTGSFGNVLSWVLYLGISLLPFGIWILLRRKGKAIPVSWVLPVFSVLLLGILYGAINPIVLFQILGMSTSRMSGSLLLGSFCLVLNSFVVMCVIVAVIKRCDSDSTSQLIGKLKFFFVIVGFLLVCVIFGSGFAEFSEVIRKELVTVSYYSAFPDYSAWAPYYTSPAVDALVRLLMEFVSSYLYLIFGWILVLLVIRLLEAMERDFYGAETAAAAESLARCSGRFLMVMVVLSFLCNSLKLVYLKGSYDLMFSAGIPLVYFGCSIILILVSRNICAQRMLKEENDLFI